MFFETSLWRSNSMFDKLETMPPDAIFGLSAKAKKAPQPKADLIVGAYRDDNGLPYPLKVVRKAERKLLDMNLNYEYLPISGYQPFIDEALKLIYQPEVYERAVGVQTLSGTGAVWLGAVFLTHVYDKEKTCVYLSNPTWANHHSIFQLAGWKNIKSYSYYDPKTVGLDFNALKESIASAPDGSIFVLHECAHNPTGVDPTHAQWSELANIILSKKHQVFFDSAYQGYASGDLDYDAYAARLFAQKGVEFLCAQSFSKNLGLYNERIGTLSILLNDVTRKSAVLSHLKTIARACYSNPPAHGARIVHIVLSDPELRQEWQAELKTMSGRIRKMRQLVVDELTKLKTPGKWDHITKQIGMFSFLGLTKQQCQFCQDHNVFITLSGRANIAGLTNETAVMLARTIDEAVRKYPKS